MCEKDITLDVGGDDFAGSIKKKSRLGVGVAQGDCKSYDDDDLFQLSVFKSYVLNLKSYVLSLKS